MVRNAILSDTAGPHTQRVAVQLRWRGPGSRVSVCGGRRVAVRRNEEGRRGARERRRRTSSWSALAWRRESSSGANKPDSAECRRSGPGQDHSEPQQKIHKGQGPHPQSSIDRVVGIGYLLGLSSRLVSQPLWPNISSLAAPSVWFLFLLPSSLSSLLGDAAA